MLTEFLGVHTMQHRGSEKGRERGIKNQEGQEVGLGHRVEHNTLHHSPPRLAPEERKEGGGATPYASVERREKRGWFSRKGEHIIII